MASRHAEHTHLQQMQHNRIAGPHSDSITHDPHALFFKTLTSADKQRVSQEYNDIAEQITATTMGYRAETTNSTTSSSHASNKTRFSRQQLEHMLADLRASLSSKTKYVKPSYLTQQVQNQEEGIDQNPNVDLHYNSRPNTPRGKRINDGNWSEHHGRPQSAAENRHSRALSAPPVRSRPNTAGSGYKQRNQRERERELSEIREAEDRECKIRFKARDVPYSTLLPRYQVLTEDMDAKASVRKIARKERIQQMVMPFSGMEQRANEQKNRVKQRRDRTRAIEKHTERNRTESEQRKRLMARKAAESQQAETFQEYEARKNVERRARIDQMARKLFVQAKLPPRQRKHQKTTGPGNQNRGRQRAEGGLTHEHTFKPKINHKIPDFDKTKQQWESTLLNARKHAVSTVPQVSDLSMFGEEAQARQELKQLNRMQRRAQEQLEESRIKSLENRRKNRNFHNILEKRPQVSLTRTQELRLKRLSNRLATERSEELKRVQEQKQRRASLDSAARELSVHVNRSEAERRAQPGYLSLDEAQRRAKTRAKTQQHEYEQHLRETREHIESKTRATRTSLVYASSNRARIESARRQALARVAGALSKADSSVVFQRGGSFDGIFDDGELVEAQLEKAEKCSIDGNTD